MGTKYENGLLDGFLRSRAQTAFLSARETENTEAAMAWVRSAIAFQLALESYEKDGDSDEVKRLTTEGMDSADKAMSLERAS